MKKPVVVYNVGDRVFAKVKGYPAWPARITGSADPKNLRYNVVFYGTYETAIIKREDVWTYNEESLAKFGKQKRKGFTEALFEIERNPDIIIGDQNLPEPVQDAKDGNEAVDASEVEEKAATPTPKAVAKRPGKRKAESLQTPPPAKQARTTTKETPSTEEKVSRSGRVIRPKKYADDKDALTPIKADDKKKSDSRKLWVQVKATGDTIEINLDKDRPATFDTRKAELVWERETAKNALKFKEMVELGQFIPDEIRRKLEAKVERTPQEEEILRNEKVLSNRKEKVRWLKIEQRLIDLDIALKMSLHYQHPNMERCLELMDELHSLAVTPLMLKKQPDIVTTVRKMRKYIGPEDPHPDPKVNDQWESWVQKIRLKANSVFSIFQAAFAVPEGTDFGKFFQQQVDEFRNVTKGLEKDKMLHLVSDPTSAT